MRHHWCELIAESPSGKILWLVFCHVFCHVFVTMNSEIWRRVQASRNVLRMLSKEAFKMLNIEIVRDMIWAAEFILLEKDNHFYFEHSIRTFPTCWKHPIPTLPALAIRSLMIENTRAWDIFNKMPQSKLEPKSTKSVLAKSALRLQPIFLQYNRKKNANNRKSKTEKI